MATRGKLIKGSITLKEIYAISFLYYKKFDNKSWRAGLDCKHIYIVARKNYSYNRKIKKWEQTGRDAKIIFKVTSRPVSYKRNDTIKIHSYPVTFLFHDIAKGVNSPFRWRTGSLKRPILAKKGKKYTKKQRIEIANKNIKNGIQLDFFFNNEMVLAKYDLLFGINYAKWLPKKSLNLDHIPYFDKHSLFLINKYIFKFLNNAKLLASLT